MASSDPIPEMVYDAALRIITREPWADDAERLQAWWESESKLTVRDIALEVIRQVAWPRGYGRTSRG